MGEVKRRNFAHSSFGCFLGGWLPVWNSSTLRCSRRKSAGVR